MTERNCPECGSDTYKVKDYDRLYRENFEIGSRFKKLHAQHAFEKAEWQLREIGLENSMKSLQRKTRKQSEALNRLEERIRKLGSQPYKKEHPALNDGYIGFRDNTIG